MIRRIALASLLALWPALASAQFATIGATPATSDNGDRLATTAWVNNVFAAGIPSLVIAGNLTVNGLVIEANGELMTNIVAPATPAAGTTRIYVDSTTKVLTFKNDAGTLGNAVVPSTAVANQFMTGISAAGVITRAQPAFSDISGQNTCAQEPALTGGVTSSAGSCATTVITNANLTGDVTSAGNATTLTNAPVIAKVLTGYAAGAGTVSAADSILTAIQKVDGNDLAKGTAWSAYTPSITAQSGTFTSVSATGRQKTVGKTIFVQITITVTTVGTAAGFISATLPATSLTGASYVLAGSDFTTGKMVRGLIGSASTVTTIAFYDNTFPGASGSVVTVSGVYESN